MKKRKPNITVKLPRPMSFEDAVKHVLRAGPAAKAPHAKRKRKGAAS